MAGLATFVMDAVVVGVGATAVMELWALVQRRLLGIPSLDFAMVGRWLGHLPRGRFRHDGIGRSAAVSGERALGWTAHYVIGMVFAALLLAVVGNGWVQAPTLGPALAFGILSVAAPFLILQPGMGVFNPWAGQRNRAVCRCLHPAGRRSGPVHPGLSRLCSRDLGRRPSGRRMPAGQQRWPV